MPGFNNQKFMKQKFEHRTDSIPVPDLADWFDKDAKPEFIVRNLTGSEFVLVQDAVQKNKNKVAMIEALVESNQMDKVDAIKDLIGNSDKVPDELARRLEMVVFGTVEPELDMSAAIKLAENFPSEFMMIAGKITQLTGKGASMVKRKPSGKTQAS